MKHQILRMTAMAFVLASTVVGCDGKQANESSDNQRKTLSDEFDKIARGNFENTNGDRITIEGRNGISYEISFNVEALSGFIECKEVIIGRWVSVQHTANPKFPYALSKLRVQVEKDARYFRRDSNGNYKLSQVCEEIAVKGTAGVSTFPTTGAAHPHLRSLLASYKLDKELDKKSAQKNNKSKEKALPKKLQQTSGYLRGSKARGTRTLLLTSFSDGHIELGFTPEGDLPDQSRDLFTLRQ